MLGVLERKAAAEGLSNVQMRLGDVESLELEGTFSVVCAFSCFEYVQDLPALIGRLARHVEPGGVVYFITARHSVIRFFIRVGNAMRQGLWMRAYRAKEITDMLQAAGFEPQEISSHLLKFWACGGILLEVLARREARPAAITARRFV
jgi:2-polyprenyl-3-methyl-5-hydroxy-6-metoxy-1,4-benzoquinol methylase